MRVAALYDIHGNAPALRAVLEELGCERVDLIVIGGDVVPGPLPVETIALLQPFRDRALFVRGNTDRWTVEAFDALALDHEQELQRPAAAWTADVIGRAERDFLASFAECVVVEVEGLGTTLFCHGSPRSDEEMLTALTPERRCRSILAGVDQRVVLCGHTHTQFDRSLGGRRVINAGSVGMPFERQPGAYWALLGPGVELRRTDYDVRAAEAELRAGGWPGVDDFLRRSFFEPSDPIAVARAFEEEADRLTRADGVASA